jgi:hypothetical protein
MHWIIFLTGAVAASLMGVAVIIKTLIMKHEYSGLADGLVTAIEYPFPKQEPKKCLIVFEFEANGRTKRGKSKFYTKNRAGLKPGDKINIMYDPKSPSRFMIVGERTELRSGIILVAASVILFALAFLTMNT